MLDGVAVCLSPSGARVTLFQAGSVMLHSGQVSDFKIDCDVLSDADLETLARLIAERCGPFGAVEGVPRGGLRLASALMPHATTGRLLIVDDVLTTGASMEQQRAERDAIGAVIFARGPCPSWVTPLFTLAALGVPPQEATADCRVEYDWSHRICERGTKGCCMHHVLTLDSRATDGAALTSEVQGYRVEGDVECEWHILTMRDGRQIQIHTDRPLVIVEPERH